MVKVDYDAFRFQFITHDNGKIGYLDGAKAALQGGCRWIQLRMKGATRNEILAVGKELKKLCKEHNAILIIDDKVEICYEPKADGVHLGKNDMRVEDARSILGTNYIIGATCHDADEIAQADEDWADYAGVGPFKFTTTKEKLNTVIGLDGYKKIYKDCWESGATLPKVAIGGITADDVPSILATGMDGVAVSGEILNAHDPVEKTREILKKFERNK